MFGRPTAINYIAPIRCYHSPDSIIQVVSILRRESPLLGPAARTRPVIGQVPEPGSWINSAKRIPLSGIIYETAVSANIFSHSFSVTFLAINSDWHPTMLLLFLSVSPHLARCAFTARIPLDASDRRGEDIEGFSRVFNGLWGVLP
jgi:hypothetical protein